MVVTTSTVQSTCPGCGVVSSRVHQRTHQRLGDVDVEGHVEVVRVKKRWRCLESRCWRTTFTEHRVQVPPRARLTRRPTETITAAVGGEVPAVSRVAEQFGVSWPTVQRVLNAAATAVADGRAGRLPVARALGIDEHRCPSVSWFREPETGA